MCGRMTLTRSGDEIAAYFALATEAGSGGVAEIDGRPLRARYNVAPSQEVLTILAEPTGAKGGQGGRTLAWKRWGLLPSWAKDPAIAARLFNARSETVDSKPSFRSAFKKRRCLVAADGFYEWTPRNRGHQPYYFTPTRGVLLGLAGLYEAWHGEGGEIIESCTVLTSDANADLEGIHHRMPVILDPADFDVWLSSESQADALKALAVPAPVGTLTRRAVDRYVNSARNDGPRCLSPEPEQSALFTLGGPEEGESA